MGYKLVKFNVIPGENEQIDAVIKVPKEPRSVIHGIVLDDHNKPRKDAVVKLLKESKNDPKHLEPLTHTFTDENGQFLFGPLCPHVKYVIKVWINHVKTREIVVKPKMEECSIKCIEQDDECSDRTSSDKQEYDHGYKKGRKKNKDDEEDDDYDYDYEEDDDE